MNELRNFVKSFNRTWCGIVVMKSLEICKNANLNKESVEIFKQTCKRVFQR